MNGRLRSVIGFALACLLVAASVPAFALPNGTESMKSGNISYGPGTTNDGFFIVNAYNGPVGGPLTAIPNGTDGLNCDGYGTGIWISLQESFKQAYRFVIKAQNGLGSFVLTDIDMSKVNVTAADYSGVTVEGYQGSNLVCSTTPFNSGGFSANTKFPINLSPFAGVRIDSFRINYVKEIGTAASTFNLASFTVADPSASSPAQSDTRLQSGTVKGQAVSNFGTAAATPQTATAGSVTITRAQSVDTTGTSPYVTQFSSSAAGAAVKVVKYASGASFVNFAADAAYTGQAISSGDRFVTRVTSQDAAIVRYYVINVTVTAEALTAASVSIPAPAAGGTPAVAVDVTGGANFAVTGLTWNGTMTLGGKFKAGTSYSATLKLTANAGYTFPAGFTNVTAAGSSSVGSFSVSGTGSGNYITCSVTFPATAALTVTAFDITGQPKLSYKEGNTLDLSGMVVTQTYNDFSQGTVTFTGGTAAGYTANPAHGTTLSRAAHDGQPVLITYTVVTPNLTDQTDSLSVVPLGTVASLSAATVKGQAVTNPGTPGASPDTAVPGSVTLSRAEGADITGTAPFSTLFTPTDSNASVKAIKYASGDPHTSFDTDAAYAGQTVTDGDRFVVRVTAEDGVTVNWYVVDVTVLLEEINSVSLAVTAPAAGWTPQNAADIPEGNGYTVSSLTWNEALTSDGYFKAGTAYTAGLTLTAKPGYTFPEDFSGVSVPSAAGVSGVAVVGAGGGNVLSLTVSFDETEALAVAYIEVTTQPKLAYKEGNTLDLTGMAVLQIYNDWTEDTVTFTDGTAADFSTDPAQGFVLSHEVYDGSPVSVTYSAVTPNLTAQTDDLAVAALSTDASLLEALIKGQAAASLGTPGASPDAAAAGSVSLTRAQGADITGTSPYITLFTPTDGFASVKAVKYASGVSHVNFASDTPYAGEAVLSGDRFVARVTAENGTNVSWYQIEATVLLDQITSASVTIPVPTAGGTPSSAADAIGSEGFTVTGLTWNGAMTADGKFKAGTVYTASLTLTSGAGYTFPAGFAGVTVLDASSVGSYLVTGTGSGNNASCVVSFPATAALYVTAIEVTGQPGLSYKHGNALDLSGMVVTQMYNDFTRDSVTFTGGTAANYTAEPVNGAILSHTLHDGQPVTVTYTGVTPHLTAQTDNLQVAPLGTVTTLSAAAVKGAAAASLGTPGDSPDTALPGSVTLSRAQGADNTGTAPYTTLFTPTDGYASVKAVKYASGDSYANFDTDTAYTGQAVTDGDRFVVRVTAEDGVTVNWYVVDVTVLLEEIDSASLTVTAPAAGWTPQNAADIPGGNSYIVSSVTWNEALTSDGYFKAGTAYTAGLTLTAKPGYTFPEDFSGVSVPSAAGVSGVAVVGAGGCNNLTLTVSFDETEALAAVYIEVTTQPKLAYKEGNALDLAGMAVRRTYNDWTEDTVTFTDGMAADFSSVPAHGAVLSHDEHDGQPVTVTYTAVTPNLTAQTDDLAVAALSADASLSEALIKGQAAASLGTPGASPDAATAGSVTLTRAQGADITGTSPYITLFTPTDGFASVKAVKYASGTPHVNFASDTPYAGEAVLSGDRFVVRVTAENGTNVNWYQIEATVLLEDIVSASVTIPVPAAGGTPSGAADAIGSKGYTVTGLAWNGAMTADGKFKAGNAYSASLTLTSSAGYTFPADFADVTVLDASSVGSYLVTGAGSGNNASCVVSFPATAALYVTAIEVTGQPKLSYKHGNTLDLSGMTVTQTYNDFTRDTVTFTGGTAANYTAEPVNGTILSHTLNDGRPVTVTYTGVTPHLTAQTDNLQVAPLGTVTALSATAVKGAAAASLGTPGASPDTALPGSVTLSRAQGADNTGTAPFITLFTPSDSNASVKAVKYASGDPHANFDTDAAYADQAVSDGDLFVVRVTAEDGVTAGWYRIEAAVLLEEIDSVSLTITVPAAGAAPQNVADIPEGGSYTVTGLAWNEALTPDRKFKAGASYSASLTLTAKPGYTFPAGFAGVTAAGSSSVGSYIVNGTGSCNSTSCAVSFPETAALYVTAIEVTGQPKLSYKDGYALDLAGMAVRQTYNDFTQDTVTFTDGTAAYYTADPSNGSALSRAAHDGRPVTVTYTGVTPNLTAQTDDLTVAALSTDASLAGAVIKGQSAAGFTMASSPEAAAETAVTLPYVSAEDTANLAPYATTFTASDAFASVKAVKYASGASYDTFGTDPAYTGQAVLNGDRFVVRVTAEDKVTVRYCVFAVTVQYSQLSAVTVSITAPIAGGSPQSAAEIAGGAGFAVTGLDFSGRMTAGGKFKAGTAYTAKLTLTADAGYSFPAGFKGVTVSGASSVDTYAVTGTGSGNSASCVAAFPETAALATALITVDTEPIKLVYRESGVLELSGLKIKRTYNDGTEDTVAFTDGTAAGFEASPVSGTVLNRDTHNGYGVKITETASGFFAYTAALSVLPPLVPDSQLEETTTTGTTVTAEGSFSDGAQLVVTPIVEEDSGYGELTDYLDGKQSLSAFEVSIVPEGFYEMPVTLSFAVGRAYNGYTVYIYHRLLSGSVELFTPTVQNGLAMITVTSLSPFMLAVDPAVEITAQPQDATVYVGQAASFTVAAKGVMPLAYQWQNRLSITQNWQDIPLAAGASHLTGAANLSHDGSQYRVRITDRLGRSVYSDAATLTVLKKPAPDTGDNSHPVLYALMTVFLAACAALLLKKRRRT